MKKTTNWWPRGKQIFTVSCKSLVGIFSEKGNTICKLFKGECDLLKLSAEHLNIFNEPFAVNEIQEVHANWVILMKCGECY